MLLISISNISQPSRKDLKNNIYKENPSKIPDWSVPKSLLLVPQTLPDIRHEELYPPLPQFPQTTMDLISLDSSS